ncbi:nucleotide exchange factor GrpE [candidate division KSB1 bacterium]|nr:nucleotide exchange factor GrpE [candidate division KSB1 bacterium]
MKFSEKLNKSETQKPKQSIKSDKKKLSPEEKKDSIKDKKTRKQTSNQSAAIKKLKAELVQSKSEIETLKDQLLRSAAELDNFRKRTEKEIGQIVKNANSRLLLDLLPVLDDLERSLKTSDAEEASTFRSGVELIHQKMAGTLKKFGVEPMESTGQDFDVEKHDALLQVKSEDMPSGKIVEEHEKGYFLNGNVLRHAKVIVSQ